MFGYVTADIGKLSANGKSEYKTYYCGLCRALSKRYGAHARWLLSFDTVFLFLILSAMEESGVTCIDARCPYRFGRRRCCVTGKIAEYAADITVILAYLNFEDDVTDSGSIKARFFRRLYRSAYEKAKQNQPGVYVGISDALEKLSEAERRGETNPDIPANIFGLLLGRVFSYNSAAVKFGEKLGRAVYLTDAACDFKSDIKHGRYNPLVCYRMSELDGILEQEYGECAAEYERLTLYRAKETADNVIYSGIRLKYELLKQLRGIKNDRSI